MSYFCWLSWIYLEYLPHRVDRGDAPSSFLRYFIARSCVGLMILLTYSLLLPHLKSTTKHTRSRSMKWIVCLLAGESKSWQGGDWLYRRQPLSRPGISMQGAGGWADRMRGSTNRAMFGGEGRVRAGQILTLSCQCHHAWWLTAPRQQQNWMSNNRNETHDSWNHKCLITWTQNRPRISKTKRH